MEKEIVDEVLAVCRDLGLEENVSEATERNKYLSAWHKRTATLDLNSSVTPVQPPTLDKILEETL